MLTHIFQEINIPQADENTVIRGRQIPIGYVNATQLVKVGGKQSLNRITRTDSWKAYVEALSDETQMWVSQLIITIASRGDTGLQATWMHPELAIEVASRISPKFKVWANRVLRQVINGDFRAITPEAAETQNELQNAWSELADKDAELDRLKQHLVTAQYKLDSQSEAFDLERNKQKRANERLQRRLDAANKQIDDTALDKFNPDLSNLPNRTNINFATHHKLQQDSGIVSEAQVKDAIINLYTAGVDYTWHHHKPTGWFLTITEEVYITLMLCFRSRRGSDISNLPPYILLDVNRFFKFYQNKYNTRNAQGNASTEDVLLLPTSVDPEQMTLPVPDVNF